MAARKLSKPVIQAQQKRIPAAVVISEATDKLQNINRHLTGIDSLISQIDEGDDWAHAIGYAIQAIRGEVDEVRKYLDELMCDGQGNVTGIEKGGDE